jgi:hypothetical protein
MYALENAFSAEDSAVILNANGAVTTALEVEAAFKEAGVVASTLTSAQIASLLSVYFEDLTEAQRTAITSSMAAGQVANVAAAVAFTAKANAGTFSAASLATLLTANAAIVTPEQV